MVGGGVRERHHGSPSVGEGGGVGKDIIGEGRERHHRSLMVEGGGWVRYMGL